MNPININVVDNIVHSHVFDTSDDESDGQKTLQDLCKKDMKGSLYLQAN